MIFLCIFANYLLIKNAQKGVNGWSTLSTCCGRYGLSSTAMQLKLIVELNTTIFTQKQEDAASSCHLATSSRYHFPGKIHHIVMPFKVTRPSEDIATLFHKLLVCAADPLFKGLIPAILA